MLPMTVQLTTARTRSRSRRLVPTRTGWTRRDPQPRERRRAASTIATKRFRAA
jgi:hypothetical protein